MHICEWGLFHNWGQLSGPVILGRSDCEFVSTFNLDCYISGGQLVWMELKAAIRRLLVLRKAGYPPDFKGQAQHQSPEKVGLSLFRFLQLHQRGCCDTYLEFCLSMDSIVAIKV